MYFYIFLASIILILGIFLENKNKRIYSTIVFLILTLIVGLRHYSIGVDTHSYTNIFEYISWYGISKFDTMWLEKGFLYLNLIIGKLTSSYTIFLLSISAITNFAICRFIEKNSKNMTMSFLLVFFTRTIYSEMNIIRQYLSVAIILLAFDYIKERKLIKYSLCMIITSLIHKSSIVLFPIYFLWDREITRNKKILISLITIAIYLFFYRFFIGITSFFGDSYTNYVDNFYASNKLASVLTFIINLIVLIMISIIKYKNKDESTKEEFFYNCQFILTVISFLCIRMSILSRICVFFHIAMLVTIPNYISNINNKKTKSIVSYTVMTFFLLSMIVILKYRPEWYNVIPYRFFWE